MAPKVLISDALSPAAVQIFRDRGVEVDFQPKLGADKEKLAELVGDFDGLAVRSATKVTPKVLEQAKRLKVIGRAGIGVDNVDIPAAPARGIIVMNTPVGNSITTAEHAITLMLALARQIPQADISTQAGKWEKNRFMGVEITSKTLGVIGCGNVGSIVANRAIGLKMKVIAYDPFLAPERAAELGVEKVDLQDLLPRADFITLHTPLTAETRNLVDSKFLARCKKGVRLINCARGGQVVGVGLDVFAEEPARHNPLFGMDNVVCTPHLGASTMEAQENVAQQLAAQMSDFLLTGAVTHAVNMPSVSAEDAPKLRPYTKLAELLGGFAGQVTHSGIRSVSISYEGHAGAVNSRPLSNLMLMGLLRPSLDDVNMVNAPVIAKERGIKVRETRLETEGDYHTLIRLDVEADSGELRIAGTLFGGKPRLVGIDDVTLEAELTPHMLFMRNEDKPGFIGRLGTLLGVAGINIANFNLGRSRPGATAVCLVAVDGAVEPLVLDRVRALPGVIDVDLLRFENGN